MRRASMILGAALLLAGGTLAADERVAAPREPKAAAEQFLRGIRDGQIEAAYDVLLAGSPIPEQAQQYLLLKGQTQSQMRLFGKALDYSSFAKRRSASPS